MTTRKSLYSSLAGRICSVVCCRARPYRTLASPNPSSAAAPGGLLAFGASVSVAADKEDAGAAADADRTRLPLRLRLSLSSADAVMRSTFVSNGCADAVAGAIALDAKSVADVCWGVALRPYDRASLESSAAFGRLGARRGASHDSAIVRPDEPALGCPPISGSRKVRTAAVCG